MTGERGKVKGGDEAVHRRSYIVHRDTNDGVLVAAGFSLRESRRQETGAGKFLTADPRPLETIHDVRCTNDGF